MIRILYLFLFCVLALASCKKESLTKAIITVYDINGNTVPGVTVTLSQEQLGPSVNQTNLISTQISDYNGQTEHVLDLEAIMNVNAYMLTQFGDTLMAGFTTVRLFGGRTISKDIEITPY